MALGDQLQSPGLIDSETTHSTPQRSRHTSSRLLFEIDKDQPEPIFNIDGPRLPGTLPLRNPVTFKVRQCAKCIQSRSSDASWRGELQLLWKSMYFAATWNVKNNFSHDADLSWVVDSSPPSQLPMWHVRSDDLYKLAEYDNDACAFWRRVWLSPSRTTVEVHVIFVDTRWHTSRHSSDYTRDLKFFARTLQEVVA